MIRPKRLIYLLETKFHAKLRPTASVLSDYGIAWLVSRENLPWTRTKALPGHDNPDGCNLKICAWTMINSRAAHADSQTSHKCHNLPRGVWTLV